MINESGDAKNYQSDPENPNWKKQDGFDECEANAKLIAAAPELLDACITALSEIQDFGGTNTPAWKALHAAITKATS